MCVITYVRCDISSDLSQDVLAVHKLDSNGNHNWLCGEGQRVFSSMSIINRRPSTVVPLFRNPEALR